MSLSSTAINRRHPQTGELPGQIAFGDMLSTELWIMISEQLSHLQDPESHDLRNLRLVSRKFYQIATPCCYLRFTIKPCHLIRRPSALGQQVLSDVRAFSQHIIVHQDDPTAPNRLVGLMAECPHLKSLEYRLLLTPNRTATFPVDINNALASQFSHLQLHIDVQKRHAHGPRFGLNINYLSIPHSHLVSINLMSRALERMHASDIDQLRNLLIRSTRLESLGIMGSRLFESWQPDHGRMPPLKELYLGRWSAFPGFPEQPHFHPDIWDLSRLTKVSSRNEVINSILPTFIGSFSYHLTAGLKSFEYSPCPRLGPFQPTDMEVRYHKQANKNLIQTMYDQRRIEELYLTSYFASDIVHSIVCNIGQTLRALKLRSSEFLDPDISLDDVICLRISCRVLIDLEISIMFPDRVEHAYDDPDHPTFSMIAMLSEIKSLQRLKLVAQSPSYSVDQSVQMQRAINEIAREGKAGAPLSHLSHLFPHCRKRDSRYESCLVDYSWDSLGKQTCKRSREVTKLDYYHQQFDDGV